MYNSCNEVSDMLHDEIQNKYLVGKFYSLQQIKNDLEKLYKTFSITKVPKASDICKYIQTKKTKRNNVNGFLIL